MELRDLSTSQLCASASLDCTVTGLCRLEPTGLPLLYRFFHTYLTRVDDPYWRYSTVTIQRSRSQGKDRKIDATYPCTHLDRGGWIVDSTKIDWTARRSQR